MASANHQVTSDGEDARGAGFGSVEPLATLFAPALARVCVVTAVAAYCWLVYAFVLCDEWVDWARVLPPAALAVAATLAFLSRARHWAAVAILAVGLGGAAALELAGGRCASAAYLCSAAVMVLGVLAGPMWAVACAAVAAGVCFLSAMPWPERMVVLRQLGLSALLVWALGDTIAQALIRAEAGEQRSWENAREAQKRRGELKSTTKALHDMYALLERTNHELEVARREAEEAREIKARFAANISHELRTPLNLIMGFSHTMYASPEVYGDMAWPPELRVDVHEIYAASRHLLGMIDDILDLSRIEAQRLPLRLEPTDIGALVREAATTGEGLLRGRPVTMAVSVAEGLPEVVVDRTRIRQVLFNLISNAIRFTDAGQISVTARQLPSEVEVTVSDTGTGIPEEDLGSIFDEFSQARGPITSGRGGAGLGLAVCREFVRLHGGRIGVESEVGKGSSFRFTIPLPGAGLARSRLVYYQPDGWEPPMPRNTLGKAAVVLAPDEASARAVARGIPGYRTIPITDVGSLAEVVSREHPAGVILVKDPLVAANGPTPEMIWAASGRTDLGVIEYEMPIESLAKEQLHVEAYLPKPVEAARLVKAISESGARPDRFLIVDDDPAFRTLMERVLHLAYPGARTQCCPGGEEALSELARSAYDVVILDLLMPGMAGIEFLLQARACGLLGDAKVMVTTGASYAEELAKFTPSRLLFTRKAPPRGAEWFNCMKGLLDAAPPDYSLPGLEPELPGERRR